MAHGYHGPPSTSTTGLFVHVFITILTNNIALIDDLWYEAYTANSSLVSGSIAAHTNS